MATANKLELSTYDLVGHYVWKEWTAKLKNPTEATWEQMVATRQRRETQAAAKRKGLTGRNIDRATGEGILAAHIECTPGVVQLFSIKDLKTKSLTDLSPLACISRELDVIGMIQRGELSGYIAKQTGEDVLPELEKSLAEVKINP